ncbi:MAG: ECF-type sigma factor [Planctomycetota bacterium]
MDARITKILEAAQASANPDWSDLFSYVYDDLLQIARGRLRRMRPGDTLRTTDLVHESFLRLIGKSASWENRRHFFGAASRAMKDILVEEARRRSRLKRGGDRCRWELGEDMAIDDERADELLSLDEALEKLGKEDELQQQIVMLRYFTGLSIDEVAKVLEVSPSTVDRNWRFARAWLLRELKTP